MSDEALEFRVAVIAVDGGCLVHDDPADCGGPLAAHHAITQQQLRHAGLDRLRWSPLNGMAVCTRAHERHHLAVERIPYDRIPGRCVAFAREHGLHHLLERYYAPPV